MKQVKPHGKNLKLAGFFILGVLTIILLSFIWKISVLIAHSRFEGKNQFILAIGNTQVKLVCFSPENHSVNVLSINGKANLETIGKDVGVPVDARLRVQKQDTSIANILADSIFHVRNDADINIIDKTKLWWFIKFSHSDTIIANTINVPISDEDSTNIIQKMFIDKTLFQEGKTIQLINATGMSGVGSRMAKEITNIGGNVVMVDTAQNTSDISSIAYIDASLYTTKRLKSIFLIQKNISLTKPSIADIIIIIGKDKITTNDF